MSGSASGPSLRGVGPQDAEERVPAGPAYEIPSLNLFLAAALSGDMPGNVKTELPLFPPTEMAHFAEPYKKWAPEPYSQLPGPPGPFGVMVGDESPPPIIRIMHIMSMFDDIFEEAFTHVISEKGADMVERSFKVTKTKIWFGIAPVSEARWKAKRLNEESNIEEALATIQVVIDVFDYLRKPGVQGQLRHVYNKIWAEFNVFQDACKALHTQRGEPVPDWSLTKLWEEYNKLHFEFIFNQSRTWTFQRLNVLYGNWKSRFIAKCMSGRVIDATQATIIIDNYAMMIMTKICDMYVQADLYIHERTDGFIKLGHYHPSFAAVDAPKAELDGVYAAIEDQRVSAVRATMQKVFDDRVAQRRRVMPFPDFIEARCLLVDREWTHKKLQSELENPLEMGMEPWVRELMDEKVERFGFVIYRLSYEGSDEEWKDFLGKLEDGLGSGWEDIIGADNIRGKAMLHWIDGREKDITEGDLVAARNSFNTFKETPDFPTGLSKTIFLAITLQSRKSFLSVPPTPSDQREDYRGFLQAASAGFTPSDDTTPGPAQRNKPYPKGYDGTFKIIDQLIWTDLFAMSFQAVQNPETYWALAAQHPWGVYVGPTTGVRRRMWREMNGLVGGLVQAGRAVGLGR